MASPAVFRETGYKWGIALCLKGLAGIAATQRQSVRAAWFFGASEALREVIGIPLRPVERAPYEREVSVARAQLAEQVFAAAWAEGRAMTMEQAIAYALGDG